MERDGYFIQKPFLSSSEVSTLKEVYGKLKHDFDVQGFHASCYSSDSSYREAILGAVREVVAPRIQPLLEDCELVSADYVVKEALEGKMQMHQDWSRVDERKFQSIVAWFPLEDTNETNGRLSVLRESHRNIVAWRGECAPGLPHYFPQFEEKIPCAIKEKYEVPLNLRAGEAVFYDARLIHFSPLNQTDHARLAINVSFVPKEAPLVHSFRSSEHTIDLLAIDNSFYTTHVMGEIPEGKKIDEVPFGFEILYPEFEDLKEGSR